MKANKGTKSVAVILMLGVLSVPPRLVSDALRRRLAFAVLTVGRDLHGVRLLHEVPEMGRLLGQLLVQYGSTSTVSPSRENRYGESCKAWARQMTRLELRKNCIFTDPLPANPL